jgi:hypothetical protein
VGQQTAKGAAHETERLDDDEQAWYRDNAGVADHAGENAGDADEHSIEQRRLLSDAGGDEAANSSGGEQQAKQHKVERVGGIRSAKESRKTHPGCTDAQEHA